MGRRLGGTRLLADLGCHWRLRVGLPLPVREHPFDGNAWLACTSSLFLQGRAQVCIGFPNLSPRY